MQALTDRQVLALTVFTTLVVAVMTLISTGGDWVTTALATPLAASMAFWSLRITRRFMARFVRPPGSTAAASPRPQPTSERPEHVQRRRERRRPRGRRGAA